MTSMIGVIIAWKGEFGFIRPDNSNLCDVFVHGSNLPPNVGVDVIGLRVEFDIATGRNSGKPQARNLRPVNEQEHETNKLARAPVKSAPIDHRDLPSFVTRALDEPEDDGRPKRKRGA